jgi:hypothetical protein
MEATPFEQVLVVALAAYVTDEPTVSPFHGLLTATVANAGAAKNRKRNRTEKDVFMSPPRREIRSRKMLKLPQLP